VVRRRHRVGPSASIEATAVMKRGVRKREPVATGARDG